MVESRVFDFEMSYDRVERTMIPGVPKLSALDVVGGSGPFLGDGQDVGCWNVNELSIRIDEPADQPRTGDAVDLGMLARDPFAADGA